MDFPVAELINKRVEYWHRNLKLTGILIVVWFVATFVVAYFALELENIDFFGWPLPFYMAAQGSLIIYVIIVWCYARAMDALDREHGFAEAGQNEEAP